MARITAGGVVAACVTIFGAAARLQPDPSGYGTHRQLGRAMCLMPVMTGHPCPTCGMTTAFAHAVRGRFIAAFHAQPAGLAIALSVAAAGVLSVIALATGSTWRINERRLPATRIALGVLIVLLAGWAYKAATFPPFLASGNGS